MILLRPIILQDRERVLDILTSEKVNATYMLPDYPNREAAEPLFHRLMEMSQDETNYVRAISLNEELVGFLNHTDMNGDCIELGYVIHPDSHGRGYMTTALSLAMEELFTLGFREILTGAFSSNHASIRVMEKCGMEPIEKSESIDYRGTTHTCIYYRKIQE